jgi:aldehyde:ferredoxin oxidoreductase
MKTVIECVAVAVAALAIVALGTARGEMPGAVAAACQAILTENMQAIVHEDADALIETMSTQTGTPAQFAEFRQQAEEMFEATDVYMHVAKFELYSYNPPYAEAWVLQQTTPKNAEDHYPVEPGRLNFRHHSALLPEHKLVVYRQRFHKENGQWKVHLVLSQPEPVDEEALARINSKPTKRPTRSNCPNGRCSSPFIRVN